ncbi:MAG: YadA-like family protein [Phascolarctobacterium sp.]|nr:YadA-like family protein [Phascolarctobacterium sp.]
MNKIYKVVWSKVKNCYVVVSELAKNVITGSVKSAKVGTAPMVKGMAMGVLMAFMITGNVSAYDHETVKENYPSNIPVTIPVINKTINVPVGDITEPLNRLNSIVNAIGQSVDDLDDYVITGLDVKYLNGATSVNGNLTVGSTTFQFDENGKITGATTTETFKVDAANGNVTGGTYNGVRIATNADSGAVVGGITLSSLATKTEVSGAITDAVANKVDKATTLAGYGITDAYTQNETNEKFATITRVNEIDTKVATNTTAIATNAGNITTLQGKVGTNTSVIDAIKADYLKEADKTELQGKIDTNTSSITANTSAIDAIEVDYLKKADKTELQGNIDTNTSNITANTSAIDAIEADYLKVADKTELSTAITTEKTRAEGIEAGLRTDVDAIKGDYLKTADKTELETAYKAADTALNTELRDYVDQKTTGIASQVNLAEVQNKTQNIDKDKTVSGTTYFNGNVEVGGNVHFNGIDLNVALIKKIDNNATGDYSIALGTNAVASKNMTVAVGTLSEAKEDCAVAVGSGTKALGQQAVAIGSGSISNGEGSLAIGAADSLDYSVDNGGDGAGSTTASGIGAIALGYGSEANEDGAIALGGDGRGNVSEANGVNSIALGVGAIANNDYSIALGAFSVANEPNVVSVGSGDEDHKDTYQYRRIVNVANGLTDYEAVNLGQLKAYTANAQGLTAQSWVGNDKMTAVNGMTIGTAADLYGSGDLIGANDGDYLIVSQDGVFNDWGNGTNVGTINLSAINRNTQNITAEAGKTYIDGELTVNKGAENQIVNDVNINDLATQVGNNAIKIGEVEQGYKDADAALKAEVVKGYEDADKVLSDRIDSNAAKIDEVETAYKAEDAAVRSEFANADAALKAEVVKGYEDADKTLSDRIASNTTKIDEVETAYKAEDAAIRSEFTNADAALKAEVVKGYEDADKVLSDRIDANAAAIEGLDDRVASNTEAIANANKAIEGLDGRVASNTEAIANANKTIADVDGRVASNTEAIANANTAIEGLDGRVASNTEAIANANKTIADVDGRVASNTEAIAAETTAREKADEVLAGAINNNAEAISGLNQRLGKMNGKINKVGAGAAALAALHPLDYDPDDKLTFAAGVGNYAGENAAALGAFYRPDEKFMVSLGGTMGNGENMVNLGVSIGLDGAKGTPKLSRKELVEKVSTMEAANEALKSENEALAARVARLERIVVALTEKEEANEK